VHSVHYYTMITNDTMVLYCRRLLETAFYNTSSVVAKRIEEGSDKREQLWAAEHHSPFYKRRDPKPKQPFLPAVDVLEVWESTAT
jgi:hypothetical protein